MTVAALPLAQALTLNVKFPLKLAELAAGVAIVAAMLGGVRWNVGSTALRLASFGLLLSAALGLFFVAFLQPGRPADIGLYRFGPIADGALQIAYMALAILTMWMVGGLARRRGRAVVKAWLAGAIASSLYAAYLNLGSLLVIPLPELPGTSDQIATVGAVIIRRAGTFLEGNFFGLYLLASLVLALAFRRWMAAVTITMALILSLSTLNLLGGAIVWIAVGLRGARGSRLGPIVPVFFVSAVLALGLMTSSSPLLSYMSDKLQNTSSQSAIERRASAGAAIQMFKDNPVLGVGVNQYALWFPVYRPSFVPSYFLDQQTRLIANNVYAQIAAEQGLLGLSFFLPILLSVVRAGKRATSALGNNIILLGTLILCVSLNAFPSPSVLFVWAFFGIVLSFRDSGSWSGERQPEATGKPMRVSRW